MRDDEQLDQQWRDGLRTLATHLAATVPPGAPERVADIVRRNARRRAALRATTSIVALAALIALVVTITLSHNGATRVHITPGTAPPTTPTVSGPQFVPPNVATAVHATLLIDAQNTLHLTARVISPALRPPVTVDGDIVHLNTPGPYAFVIEGAAGHSIGFTDLPNRDRIITDNHTPQRVTINLPRGEFILDCNVPGHAAAGMLLHVIVGGGTPNAPTSTIAPIVTSNTGIVIMPQLRGFAITSARPLLRAAGLGVLVAFAHSATQPAGSIITTEPPAGTHIQRGTTVTVIVSRGH